jgi:hypothetical protein
MDEMDQEKIGHVAPSPVLMNPLPECILLSSSSRSLASQHEYLKRSSKMDRGEREDKGQMLDWCFPQPLLADFIWGSLG